MASWLYQALNPDWFIRENSLRGCSLNIDCGRSPTLNSTLTILTEFSIEKYQLDLLKKFLVLLIYFSSSGIQIYLFELLYGFMEKTENDMDICYSLENANTSRQETDIAEIIRKRNAL